MWSLGAGRAGGMFPSMTFSCLMPGACRVRCRAASALRRPCLAARAPPPAAAPPLVVPAPSPAAPPPLSPPRKTAALAAGSSAPPLLLQLPPPQQQQQPLAPVRGLGLGCSCGSALPPLARPPRPAKGTLPAWWGRGRRYLYLGVGMPGGPSMTSTYWTPFTFHGAGPVRAGAFPRLARGMPAWLRGTLSWFLAGAARGAPWTTFFNWIRSSETLVEIGRLWQRAH